MTAARWRARLIWFVGLARWVAVLVVAVSSGYAAGVSYDLVFRTPRLEAVEASLAVATGPVRVRVEVNYDVAGAARWSAAIDGVPATAAGSVRATTTGVAYRWVLREQVRGGRVVTLAGSGNAATAIATVAGGTSGARWKSVAAPVTVRVQSPVAGTLDVVPEVSDANVISGEGRMETAYASSGVGALSSSTAAASGNLRGRVTRDSLVWVLRQGTRSASFRGLRVGDAYVGTLRVAAKPAMETFTNYSVRAADFPVRTGDAVVRGLVLGVDPGAASPGATVEPAVGAAIVVREAVTETAAASARVLARGVADADGRYELKLSVRRGAPVIWEVTAAGMVPVQRRFESLTPGLELLQSAVSHALEERPVRAGAVESVEGSWHVTGLAPGVMRCGGRVLSPTVGAEAWAGGWLDIGGGPLMPGLAFWLEARDSSGRRVKSAAATPQPGGNTGLAAMVRLPREAWAGVNDRVPGTDRIEVPVYAWDEGAGRWRSSTAAAFLVTASGMPWTEPFLEEIRDGRWAGEVYLSAQLSGDGGWAMAWPAVDVGAAAREWHGTLIDWEGRRVSGAQVQMAAAEGVLPGGTWVTGEEGGFVVGAIGQVGASWRGRIRAVWNGRHYDLGEVRSEGTAWTSGPPVVVGTLVLDEAQKLDVRWCDVGGRVANRGVLAGDASRLPVGEGVPGAWVTMVDIDAWTALPASAQVDLGLDAVMRAGDDGGFVGTIPVLSGAFVWASSDVSAGGVLGCYRGSTLWAGCDAGAVAVGADYVGLGYFAAQLEAGQGEWAGVLTVIDGVGNVYLSTEAGVQFGEWQGAEVPAAFGLWRAVGLREGSLSGVPGGNILLEVIELHPASGTWRWESEDGSVVRFGRWEQSLPGG